LNAPHSLDIAEAIDSQPIRRFQLMVFALCFFCLIADGFDAQALGYVVPLMSKEWGLTPAKFAPAFSMGLVGMAVGALALGSLADYIGRRWIIIGCVAVAGFVTLSMAAVTSLPDLIKLRFLAGLALGGLIPNALALGSEYSPTRWRAVVVMVTACGISIGSAVGGLVAGALLKSHGWPIVFQIGGSIALGLAVLTALALPESVRFRAVRKPDPVKTSALMRRIAPGLQVGPQTTFIVQEEKSAGLTVRHLFSHGRLGSTLLLWVIYFCSLLEIYVFASWLPTVLTRAGVSLQWSVYATSALQIAGTVASLLLGTVLERFNPGRVLTLLYLFGAIAVFSIGLSLHEPWLIVLAASCAGFGIVGGQAGTHAVASRVYPTFMRSTGMGWALGIGRVGSVIGPLIGGMLLARNWPAPDMLLVGAVPALVAAAAAFGLSRRIGGRNSSGNRIYQDGLAPAAVKA
jgi:AAHS family 4-hydroxybenzoate transporter-like MFS transporter